MYLDTTFAHTSHTFHAFPTKAEGIAELLRKLEAYPDNTMFYFRAWTFGYEEVWTALAAFLKSKVNTFYYMLLPLTRLGPRRSVPNWPVRSCFKVVQGGKLRT